MYGDQVVRLLGEDAGKGEPAAGPHVRTDGRRKRLQWVGEDVGDDDVELPPEFLRRIVEVCGDLVAFGVASGGADRLQVDIDTMHVAGAELGRGDRENA